MASLRSSLGAHDAKLIRMSTTRARRWRLAPLTHFPASLAGNGTSGTHFGRQSSNSRITVSLQAPHLCSVTSMICHEGRVRDLFVKWAAIGTSARLGWRNGQAAFPATPDQRLALHHDRSSFAVAYAPPDGLWVFHGAIDSIRFDLANTTRPNALVTAS